MSGSLLGTAFLAFLVAGTLAVREQAEAFRWGYRAEGLRVWRDQAAARVARLRAAAEAAKAGDALRARARALGLDLRPATGFPVLLPGGRGPAWQILLQASRSRRPEAGKG